MNFETSTGRLGTRGSLIGRLSTGLECWPKSFTYLGCRVGLSGKRATVYVFVCVSDAMVVSCDAIRLVDVGGVVTFKNRSKKNDINRFRAAVAI